MVCVDEVYIKKLALEAQEIQKQGHLQNGKLPSGSFAGTNSVKEKQPDKSQLSKNQKKKLRKKQNKAKQLLEKQISQMEEAEKEGLSTVAVDDKGDRLSSVTEEVSTPVKTVENGDSVKESQSSPGQDWRTKNSAELLLNLLDPDCIEKGLKVKLADLGNACWTYKHFTNDMPKF